MNLNNLGRKELFFFFFFLLGCLLHGCFLKVSVSLTFCRSKEIFQMNLIRSTILTLSIGALMFSTGSSSLATTDYSHPQFTVAEDRILSLQETGSRLVVDTIENALRQGGLALFDENFQIDSSLNWVFGEAVGGELDAVIPLWSKGRHNVFAQPGFALWRGLADDDRLDGNLGVVYRTETIKGIIGGASLFYDHDFQIGHSRLGIGVDAQRDGFYGAFNYYLPLSDTQDAREGYVEDALQGMDASVAVESDVTRVGGNVGYWLFQGEEDVEDEWEFSYGLEAGLRLMPGIFLEGRLERHDKAASFGRRASVGLAFRFTLPNLDGKSYGDGGEVSNLHRPVDREKRILYEEREAVSKVRLSAGVSQTDDNMRIVAVQLDETFAENVVLNLIGSGSATYNDDWTISIGGTDCSVVDGTNCSVTVMAGETSPNDEVVITFQDPDRGEPAEDIILSVEIASTGVDLAPGNPLVVRIPAGEPLPTVSFDYDRSDTLTLGRLISGKLNATLNLSETLSEDVTVNITTSGTAVYGHDADWDLTRRVPAGDDDAHYSLCGTTCEVMFAAGQTSADIQFTAYFGSAGKTVGAEIQLPTETQDFLRVGSPSRLDFTIGEAPPPPTTTHTVSFSEASNFLDEGRDDVSAEVQITISPTPTEAVDIPITVTGDRDAFVNPIMVSPGTLTLNAAPDNNGVIAFPANTASITITMFPAQDGADGRDDITIALGTLPSDYGPGMITSWELAIHDDD